MGAVPTMLIALPEVRAESGPTTSQPWTRWIATQLSRMVEMTSWTPRSAFRRPGSAPQMPPASAADARQTGTRRGAGRSKALPATAAASAPQMSCPSAPMLKTPTVNGIATERPVRTRTLPFTALSPSAAALPNAPSKRCANPSAAFLPEARMATNDTARAMATATTAPHNGSRDGANPRARGLRGMIAVAEHEPPEHLVARGRIRLSRDASLEEDGDAVADRAQLVEVGGDDDHRRACPRRRAQRVVQAARRRQVEPARRLCGDDELRRGSSLELARGDELLLVAAREVACPRERIRRAHVEGADQLRRLASPAGAIDERTARMGRIAMPSQREVLLAGERQAESAPARVVGQMDHSAAACGERRPRPTFLAVQAEHTGRGAKPAERFDELGLPVALDSGHPEDLAARHRQGRAAKTAASLPAAAQVDAFEPRRARCGKGSRRRGNRRRASHHRSGKFLRAHFGNGALEHDAAAAQHRDPVRDRPHLAELVRDEEDGAPRAGKLAHRGEQLRDLRGSEDRGRLVEDEHPRAPPKLLHDLDPLLRRDPERLDRRVDLEAQPRAVGGRPYLPPRALGLEASEPAGLPPEHHVLPDAERRHEQEVLVDGSDAGTDGGARVAGRHLESGRPDRAGILPVQAAGDVHQGGFPRAVLADEREDLSCLDGERDVLHRRDAREALGDALQQQRGFRHRFAARRFPVTAGSGGRNAFSSSRVAGTGMWRVMTACCRVWPSMTIAIKSSGSCRPIARRVGKAETDSGTRPNAPSASPSTTSPPVNLPCPKSRTVS